MTGVRRHIRSLAWLAWVLLGLAFLWTPTVREAVALLVVTVLLCTSEILRGMDGT